MRPVHSFSHFIVVRINQQFCREFVSLTFLANGNYRSWLIVMLVAVMRMPELMAESVRLLSRLKSSVENDSPFGVDVSTPLVTG